MNKILLIIKREYFTRIRKRTFIISTILFPLFYVLLIFGSGYIASKSVRKLNVAVIDSSGLLSEPLVNKVNKQDSSSYLTLITSKPDSLIANYSSLGYDGYVIIPAVKWDEKINEIPFKTNKTHGVGSVMEVQSKLNMIWGKIKADSLGMDERKRAILNNSNISLKEENEKNKEANAKTATTIGYVCGILIYIIMILYGSQVMMGVMEEKTNRIAEVVISSVRPFQLMIGKIIGIGMVALTQFLIWIAFMLIVYNVGKVSSGSSNIMSGLAGGMQDVFLSINMPLLIFCFIFYLLGGFFFYSSLYAAIGSSINEDMREAQSLSFPVTMLIIFSIIIMSSAIVDPGGKLAMWASIIPFSSPIVMMARIPFGVPETVPWWQLGVSMLALIAGFIFTTWFAGKIYRTGILMYGKKPTWKEMLKWAFRKS